MATKTRSKKKTTRKKTPGEKNDIAGVVKKSLFLLVAMAWAFILGVLVGKGYKPENAVPEIARIMPGHPKISDKKSKILTAEELDFYDRLKNPQTATQKPVVAHKKFHIPAKKSVSAHKKKTTPPQPKQSLTRGAKKQAYKYVYQVAAFRAKADAMRFRQKIIDDGIAAFVSKPSGGWYRVTVRFTGTRLATKKIQAKLKILGISRPILRDKKPI